MIHLRAISANCAAALTLAAWGRCVSQHLPFNYHPSVFHPLCRGTKAVRGDRGSSAARYKTTPGMGINKRQQQVPAMGYDRDKHLQFLSALLSHYAFPIPLFRTLPRLSRLRFTRNWLFQPQWRPARTRSLRMLSLMTRAYTLWRSFDIW